MRSFLAFNVKREKRLVSNDIKIMGERKRSATVVPLRISTALVDERRLNFLVGPV